MALFTRSNTPKPVEVAVPPSPAATANGRLVPPSDPVVEQRLHVIGREYLEQSRKHRAGLLSAAFWSDKLMEWAMKDEAFKVQLFRFVDTFPVLKTPEQIHEHLVDYLSQPGVTPPPGMSVGLKAGGLIKGAMSRTVSKKIVGMAEKFIAGEDAASALPQLAKLWTSNIAFSVDLLGEACLSDTEASMYQAKYLDLVNALPGTVEGWDSKPQLERDHLGTIPRTNVSIKISSLYARTDPIDTAGSIAGLMDNLQPILDAAAKNNVFINFDMEHFGLKDLTLELFMRCCESYDFPAGLAMQAYLRSGDDDARRIIEWSKRTGRQVTVRLVKGAYWDAETIEAEQEGWPVPVWSRKIDTDACFERMTEQFIDAIPRTTDEGGVKFACGSHNLRSIANALALLEKADLPTSAIELQMLHGMADDLKGAAVERGLRIREYVPVGEMIPGMAYLVRRLLENTSNESWLLASSLETASPDQLLASPHMEFDTDPGVQRIVEAPERHALSDACENVADGRAFFSVPLRDFAQADERKAFAAAISEATVPGVANDTSVDAALNLVKVATSAFPAWRDTKPATRAAVLTRAAQLLRDRRDELSGVVIRESGKPWREADADVCETIDFCEYYARESMKLFEPQRLGNFVGELDQQLYQPRGVAVVISPWNFPLAICCGMTVAALVTGNCVIVKPAEQTPGIAKLLCEILWEAGAPRDVLHFCPGLGETVGAALVRDEGVHMIAFTGSKAVGLDIIQAAAVTPATQPFVKSVVCEMGGKNAIIVDTSADLDEAVVGVRYSAFGYQGQKCSACSRVIVVDTAHDPFLKRLVESTRSLVIGNPMDSGTDVGPVIDDEAATKIRSYIDIGSAEGNFELGEPVPEGLAERVGKPYITPHIFSGIRPEHRLANEEIFGPVLAVIRAADFDEALAIANATPYKLTGGVFSRKPAHLDQARREFRVGNLYLNRSCTGALVGRQPFGGFGMSGIGAKAGGRDYLYQFVEPRAICENTMRRGFAPGL